MNNAKTTDLSTTYLGLQLSNPLVASASPLTGHLDTLLELEAAGIGAIVLPSLFEEEIEHEAMTMHHDMEHGVGHHGEVFSGYFPELGLYKTGPERYLDLLIEAKDSLAVPVIASLNGTTSGGWIEYAKILEDAGADALELNIYAVAADAATSGGQVEAQYLQLVSAVRKAVELPLAIKVGPYFSSMANMAQRFMAAGADGLVLFNRFYQPDFDLDTLTTVPNLLLSTPAEMRLVLRWMAILSGQIDGCLAASSGVHDADSVVKLLLAGADVTMMASALLQEGTAHVATVLRGVQEWFSQRDYDSVAQARGSLNQASSPDPSAFERTNYMKTLTSYTSHS